MLHTETVVTIKNQHEARTDATRAFVLAAAEKVFVQEGFERAQIETIAKAAGRTKGSVYANFRNKDEIFLAVCEKRTKEIFARLLERVLACGTQQEAVEQFRDFLLDLFEDNSWPLLMLEFKLYSLRHPETRELWISMQNAIGFADRDVLIHKMFGKLSVAKERDIDSSMAAISPLLSGLILEAHFEPELLSPRRSKDLFGRLLTVLVKTD
ncbi:MAG: TetR/AcrR family transcriptional regulator [Acidobacteriaceae bacterium]